MTVTVADDWSRGQFTTFGTTTSAATEITVGICSLCGGEVKGPAYWMGTHRPPARCVRCHATEAPPKPPAFPVIEMIAPYVPPAIMASGLPLSQSVDARIFGDSVL